MTTVVLEHPNYIVLRCAHLQVAAGDAWCVEVRWATDESRITIVSFTPHSDGAFRGFLDLGGPGGKPRWWAPGEADRYWIEAHDSWRKKALELDGAS